MLGLAFNVFALRTQFQDTFRGDNAEILITMGRREVTIVSAFANVFSYFPLDALC